MLITTLKLTRNIVGNNNSLFGTLEVISQNHGTFKFSTVENYEKKIKAGKYNTVYTLSPKFDRKTLEITGVQHRRGIRIHPANRGCDVTGCIGLGLYTKSTDIPLQIFYSRTSTEILEAMLWRAKATPIEIINNYEKPKTANTSAYFNKVSAKARRIINQNLGRVN